MATLTRLLHYYELDIKFHSNYSPSDGDMLGNLFKEIMNLSKTKNEKRYQLFGERIVGIQSIKFDRNKKIIYGKLLCIRKDLFPEIINTDTDKAKGIEAAESEGLLETTHFLINHSNTKPILCIEYNQFGSKIGDLVSYIFNLGNDLDILEQFNFLPLVKDELRSYKKRIGECSAFTVKVHKDNIDKIKKLDNQLFSALEATVDQFESEYAEIKLKFDYKHKKNQTIINSTIQNLLNSIISKKSNTELFDTLKIRAEDSERSNLLETFDLLVDKVKSEVVINRKQKYKTIVSDDMFEKMTFESEKILKYNK